MKTLQVGVEAPLFELKDQNGESFSLKNYIGKTRVVLYFYPKALTPGCTIQAEGIRDAQKEFEKKGVVVIGISNDPCSKLKKFEEKKTLNFKLLSDEGHEVLQKYGVWGEKSFMGKIYMGIARVTYIIGLDGKIEHVIEKVTTKTHHQDVLNLL